MSPAHLRHADGQAGKARVPATQLAMGKPATAFTFFFFSFPHFGKISHRTTAGLRGGEAAGCTASAQHPAEAGLQGGYTGGLPGLPPAAGQSDLQGHGATDLSQPLFPLKDSPAALDAVWRSSFEEVIIQLNRGNCKEEMLGSCPKIFPIQTQLKEQPPPSPGFSHLINL